MVKLSLAMIVKNEEDVLARCLECVKSFVDEIIIVDTGSTDLTKKIARKFTNKVFNFKWIDDFSAARNFSFKKATGDYIMWLDADDFITPENQTRLKNLKETLSEDTEIVMLKYNTSFDSEEKPLFSFYRERIIKNNNTHMWNDPVHEYIVPCGKIVYKNIAVEHRPPANKNTVPQRNLNIYRRIIKEGVQLSPRQTFYYARELMHNNFYSEAALAFESFLNENKGWKENNIEACKNLAFCFKNTNNNVKCQQALLKSFEYDIPRAEICCDLGNLYLENNQFARAIFWFKIAASSTPKEESGAFFLPDCYGFIPHIQMCLCYDKLGNFHLAHHHNTLAASFKPNSLAVKHNEKYFLNLKANN